MKIKEYITLHGVGPSWIDDQVMSKIKQGYQPYGHPYVGMPSFQVMVKYEEENTIHGLDKMFEILNKDIKERESNFNYKQTIDNIVKIIDDMPGVLITDVRDMARSNDAINAIYKIKQEIENES